MKMMLRSTSFERGATYTSLISQKKCVASLCHSLVLAQQASDPKRHLSIHCSLIHFLLSIIAYRNSQAFFQPARREILVTSTRPARKIKCYYYKNKCYIQIPFKYIPRLCFSSQKHSNPPHTNRLE